MGMKYMERILLISCEGLGNGGTQSVIMKIVRNLSNRYIFDIVLFTNEKRHYDDEFEQYGGKIYRVPFYSGSSILRRKLDYFIRPFINYNKIRRILIERGPYKAVHCHNSFESWYILKAAKKANIDVRIAHAHTSAKVRGHYLRKIYESVSKRMIVQYATNLVACSKKSGEVLFGGEVNYDILYNSYDEHKFDPCLYDVNINCLSLVQIGSYSVNKNQLFSLDLIKQLNNIGVEASISFVGFELDNGYEERIKQKVCSLEIEEKVSFYPSDYNIPELMSRCAYLILPSYSEGFSVVLIEGQAMGMTCFVSNTTTEETNFGGCVYLPLNVDAWTNAIHNRYIEDRGKRNNYNCTSVRTCEYVSKINDYYSQKG